MKEKLLLVAGGVSVAIFLLLFSYTLTLKLYPLTPEQQNTFYFLQSQEELILNYTAAEVSHLEDVAEVMKSAQLVLFLSGIILLILWFHFRKDKEELQKLLKYGGISTVVLVFIILIALLLGFNSLFTLFHQLFFPQGNWQFAADSLLIQTFPLDLFVVMGRRIFLLALVFGGMMFSAAYLLKRKIETKN